MRLQRPRELRHATAAKARLDDGQRQSDIVIGNVSSRGLMAKCDSSPAEGARIEILYRELRIAGRVAWARSGCFGLESDEAIDLAGLFAPRAPRAAPRRFVPPHAVARRTAASAGPGFLPWISASGG